MFKHLFKQIPFRRNIYSFSSSNSTQTSPSIHLKSRLQHTLTKIQSQIQQLPSEVEDGTTFSYLYNGVLSSMQDLVNKTNQIIEKIDQNNQVDVESIESAYQYIDQMSKQYIEPAISLKNNAFKDKILNYDMKLGVVLNMMDKIIYVEEKQHKYLSQERVNELLAKHGEVMKIDSSLEEIKEQSGRIKSMLSAISAVIIYGEKYKHPMQRDMMFLFNIPRSYYFFNKSSSLSIKHYKKPEIQNIVKIFNTGQTGWKGYCLAWGLRFLYPVKTSQMIYIPRKEIDQNEIACDIFKKDERRIPVRVLIDKEEPIHDYKDSDNYYAPEPYDAIVIHIHGGGFIALSSLTSESYTRRWAKETKLPVFSINYRLAPDHPYPSALEDVYHSYLFIIDHIHKYSDIRFKRVILAGDSAGGNLACALTGLLLKRNKPVPDSLLLAYPSLDLRAEFSRSRIHSFNDPLLFATMLMSIREAYVGKQSDNHPLVSPIFLTQNFINQSESNQWPSKWPKTRILVGNQDPLLDDSLTLLDKLDKANIDTKITIMDNLGHAFLNLDIPIPACTKTIQKSIEKIKQLSTD